MANWSGDGGVSGFYYHADDFSPKPTDIDSEQVAYLLATNALVDVEGVTRLQYPLTDALFRPGMEGFLPPANDRIDARANFDFGQPDVDDNPGRVLTASMFIAKASDLPAAPTPAQLLALPSASLIVSRASTGFTDSEPHAFYIYGPRVGVVGGLVPNTKYWVMVAATHVPSMGSTPNKTNDIPLDIAKARGISMWTNRPPAAPVITSPPDGATAPAGSVLTFSFTSDDPDRRFGGTDVYFTDLAGVQVQFAPQPTPANPSPAWQDLPIAGASPAYEGGPDNSQVLWPGWYIAGHFAPGPDNGAGISVTEIYGPAGPPYASDGAWWLRANRAMPLDCSVAGARTPLAGQLGSGAWQLRMRTFDFGHPYPRDMQPFGRAWTDHFHTPADAPASNTSPWSEPVNITISEQVPAPVPVSPVNGVAVAEGAAVTLSWLYRNTYVPPFMQGQRTVQIRQAGETTWTTLVSGNSSSPTHLIDTGAYPLTATRGYEWRVGVVDASGAVSAYSPVASFWVVPAPASGSVRPISDETVSGATLGCGSHKVFVYRRGGLERVGELTNLTHVDWNRVRDDISDAKIVVSDWGVDCGDLLKKLQCWAYEIVIFRDNGFGVERVWEGPITLLTYEQDSVTIHAKDVMAYAYRRIIKQAMNDSGQSPTAGDSVTSRATRILQNVFAPDDPNVLAYLTPILQADDPKQYRSLPPYSRTAFEEVDDMAANAGLDYTCSGRSILLWSTKHRIGTLPEFRDDDLGAPPIVSEYGMSMADRYVVSDGNGIWGEATRGLDEVSGNSPTYGLVEMLSSTWASESEEEAGTYTEEGIETVRQSFEEYAERSIADRYPPPVVVRVPDNTTINPGTVLSIQQLVPGVVIPLRSTGTLRSVVANQKLDKVQVTEVAGSETISVTLSPFSRDDVEVVEG